MATRERGLLTKYVYIHTSKPVMGPGFRTRTDILLCNQDKGMLTLEADFLGIPVDHVIPRRIGANFTVHLVFGTGQEKTSTRVGGIIITMGLFYI